MRFFGALFLGACYANVAERSTEPVLTTLIPEVANPPKETQASVDARLALVAVCPEATSDCSVPTGPEAENEELADALDCMLKINISSIPAGPCHDALKQFLDDHLNPANRVPQVVSPAMLIMRSQPGPSPLAEILQRMAANSRPAPQPMMFPQDPRFQQSYPQNFRGNLPTHGFPPMFGSRGPMERDSYDMRSRGQGSSSRNRNRNSNNRNRNNRNSRNSGEEEGHWDYVWHSTRSEPKESRSGRGSRQHHMPPPPPHPMPSSSRRMPSRTPPRMSSPPRQMSLPSHSRSPSRMSSSSSSMNPMMMLLPRLMGQESSQNPMSGIIMATLMKKMAPSGYDYDYDYGYDYEDEAMDDYDYDYDYEDEPAPSPFASLIQKMLQQKLAARQAAVQVSLSEPAQIVDAPSPLEFSEDAPATPVEIAQARARSDKEIRMEQVSYRSAP